LEKKFDIGERHGKDKITHCEERVANSFVTDQLTLTKLGSQYAMYKEIDRKMSFRPTKSSTLLNQIIDAVPIIKDLRIILAKSKQG
jgi:hypothetical protein